MGRQARLAAEIPDIFRHGWRRAGKFRNDDGLGVVAVCFEGDCGRGKAKQSFAGRIPKRSLGTTETTEGEVFARHRGIIAQGSGLRAASGEDGTREVGFPG